MTGNKNKASKRYHIPHRGTIIDSTKKTISTIQRGAEVTKQICRRWRRRGERKRIRGRTR